MTHHDETQSHEETSLPQSTTEDQLRSEGVRLGEELKEFGRHLVRAIRSIAGSEELKELGNDVVESFRSLGEEIQETFEKAKDKEEVRAAGEQARRVSQAVTRGVPAVSGGDIQSNLSHALRSLNDELNKVIDQIQSRSARVSEEVEGTAREAGDEVSEKVDEARESATAAWKGAEDAAKEASESVSDKVDAAKDSASDMANKVEDSAEEMADDAEDTGRAMLDEAEDKSEKGARTLSEIVDEIQDTDQDTTPGA